MSEYSNAVFSDFPVAYYRCDEVSGTVAVDDTVNAYNGTYQGVNSYSQTGAIVDDNDTSLLFAGATGALFFPPNLVPNVWTKYAVEFWINTGAWKHVILTYDGTNLTGYQNGVLYTGGSWYNGHYSYKKIVTIDHTKVSGSSDLSDFPMLFSVTDADLKTVANGGKVQNSNGYDIIFTDATGGYLLPHEIESYDPVAGTLKCWVRVPLLSHSVDTLINLYIGNSSISTFQTEGISVWDSNYLTVYHMGDNAANTTIKDSTSFVNNGTAQANTSTTTTTGIIDGGVNLNGTTNYLSVPTAGMPIGATPFTVGMWIKPGSQTNVSPALITLGTDISLDVVVVYYIASTGGLNLYDGANHNTATGLVSAGNFAYIVVAYDGSTLSLYSNAAIQMQLSNVTLNLIYGLAYIGNDAYSEFFTGVVDEFRVSKGIARSSSWIATEYSNQNAPGSFYAVGAAQSLAASVIAPNLMGQGLNFAGGSNPTIDEVALYNSAFTAAQAAWHYNVGSTGRSGIVMFPAIARRDGSFPSAQRRGI